MNGTQKNLVHCNWFYTNGDVVSHEHVRWWLLTRNGNVKKYVFPESF